MSEKELIIKEFMNELQLDTTYKGYHFIVYGITLLLEQRELLTCMTRGLYSKIADYYHTNIANVERNIRTAVYVIWEKNRNNSLFEGCSYCPSNGVFMDLCLHEIEKRNE